MALARPKLFTSASRLDKALGDGCNLLPASNEANVVSPASVSLSKVFASQELPRCLRRKISAPSGDPFGVMGWLVWLQMASLCERIALEPHGTDLPPCTALHGRHACLATVLFVRLCPLCP
jgi:hypothetical protein